MSKYDFHKDLQKMINRYVAGTATAEEIKFVESYYAYLENKALPDLSEAEAAQLREAGFEKIIANINNPQQPKTTTIRLYKYAAAAAVLLITFAAGYFFLRNGFISKQTAIAVNKPFDVAPGSNKAVLTLADGTKVTLDDKKNGKLKQLAGISIVKTKSGQLAYVVSGQVNDNLVAANNTITTPKGGQYQVILPDGTKVCLNAASSLTYPEFFKGNMRQVKLEGEGYFEVAKNKAMPFHVITHNQDVEVTGTHFNIDGYMDDRSINTTLLEGSVNVHSQGQTAKIIPGQQALVFNYPAAIKVKPVNTEEEVAWTKGLFQFNNLDLKNIMNQLERWYDIKVDYQSLPAKRYNGMVPRNAQLSEVLKMLELTGNIRFQILANKQIKVISNINSTLKKTGGTE